VATDEDFEEAGCGTRERLRMELYPEANAKEERAAPVGSKWFLDELKKEEGP
jgi:hypothetical protein